MSEEQDETPTVDTPESGEGEGEGEQAPGTDTTKDQVPAHIPPHLRELFTKHEGAVAAKPGFRNPSNKKSKAQRKKRKKGKKKERR